MHVLPSLHCAAVVQHPATAEWMQVRFVVLQRSFVHAFESSQSALAVQQPGIGVLTQSPGDPDEVSQESVVQTSPSAHCAAVVQLVAAWRTDPVGSSESSAGPQRTVPKASNAPKANWVRFSMFPLRVSERFAPKAGGRALFR